MLLPPVPQEGEESKQSKVYLASAAAPNSATDMHGMAEDSPAGVMVGCCQNVTMLPECSHILMLMMLMMMSPSVHHAEMGTLIKRGQMGGPCQSSSNKVRFPMGVSGGFATWQAALLL